MSEDLPQESIPARRRVEPCDFSRPADLSAGERAPVSAACEAFARLTTSSLSAQLRTTVRVNLESVKVLSYGEFVRPLTSPATFAVASLAPLNGDAVFWIAGETSLVMVDRRLGGSGRAPGKLRPLTEIEQSVMEGILSRMLANMSRSWAGIVAIRPALREIVPDAHLARAIPAWESVIACSFGIKIREGAGAMSVCVPCAALEGALSRRPAAPRAKSAGKGGAGPARGALWESLSGVALALSACLGTVSIPIRDVLSLGVGDVIRLNTVKAGEPVVLRIGGKEKFYCRPGISGRRLSVQITGKIEGQDEEASGKGGAAYE